MKATAQKLLTELELQLSTIQSTSDDPIIWAEQALKHIIAALQNLKSNFENHQIENKADEIEFFKKIKPKFASKLIFYNEIYSIELAKPSGGLKSIRKYYNRETAKIKSFFDENKEFYKYYRSGNSCFDKKYFLRQKHELKLSLDSSYLQSDHKFATSHDYKVAQIIAYDELLKYLESKIKNTKNTLSNNSNQNAKTLQWTGSKVALIELMYALHTEGVFNNGKASLNEIATLFQDNFQINLNQFNRVYLEIRSRKTIDKTNFLNSLKVNLNQRMEEADEK